MSQKAFLFIYNDNYGRIRHRSKVEAAPVSDQLQLSELLNLQEEEFFSILYLNHKSVWESKTNFQEEFLTTVMMRTILNLIGFPFISIGESRIFNQSLDSIGVEAEDLFMIGISTTFIFDVHTLETLIGHLKSKFPNVPILIGGAGFTLNPHWFENCSADFGLSGDGEEALKTFLEAFTTGQTLESVPNLYYKTTSGRVLVNPWKDINLNTAPTPVWDCGRGWPRLVWYESLRGCPFRCKFCSYPQQSPNWRFKSAERMFEEWRYYAEQGVRFITCLDSTMLTPPARMRQFCNLLIQHHSPIKWHCWGHPSQLQSSELIAMMAAAGCCSISMGVESGDDQILKNMRKFVSREKSISAIQQAKEAGLLVTSNFIIGFPGETRESINNTFQFILEAAPDVYSLQAFQIRDRNIPILEEADTYHLDIQYDTNGVYQSWNHATMSSEEAEQFSRHLEYQLLQEASNSISGWLIRTLKVRFNREAEEQKVAQYRRNNLNPIMKELERAMTYHPCTTVPYDVTKSLDTSRFHAQNARAMLAHELKRNHLYSPRGNQLIHKLESLPAVSCITD